MSNIDFDTVLQHIGECGLYQQLLYYLICIPATLSSSWMSFSQVFVFIVPNHWCRLPELSMLNVSLQKQIAIPKGSNGQYSKCRMYSHNLTELYEMYKHGINATENLTTVPCKYGWEFELSHYESTIVTQMELVCDKEWLISVATTSFFIGSLWGNILFGWISDRWGRKIAFLLTFVLQIPLSVASVFSVSYDMYVVLRAIIAMNIRNEIDSRIGLEIMGPEYRTYAGMMICVLFALALCMLAGMAYSLQSWFKLMLYTSVPFVVLLSFWWIIPESPRWLLTKGRLEEAKSIMQDIARMNKKNFSDDLLATADRSVTGRKIMEDSKNFSDVFRYPVLRKKFLIITFIWITNAVVYNGLNFNVSNLKVSDHLAFFIGAAVEIPSYFFFWWAMDKYGRKLVLCASMIIGGVTCMLTMIVPEDGIWTILSLAMVGKFCNAGSFAVIYVYAGELIPTVVRGQAMGISSFLAGLGIIGFPFIVQLGKYYEKVPLIFFGFLMTMGGLFNVFLPETLHTHLLQTIEEEEAISLTIPKCFKTSSNTRWGGSLSASCILTFVCICLLPRCRIRPRSLIRRFSFTNYHMKRTWRS